MLQFCFKKVNRIENIFFVSVTLLKISVLIDRIGTDYYNLLGFHFGKILNFIYIIYCRHISKRHHFFIFQICDDS